jgi:hypothetical protein
MAKHPPVPPENRNPHDTGTHPGDGVEETGNAGKEPKNPDKHGQQANTRQNTTHQGYQQDR